MLSIDERINKAEERLKKLKQDQRLEQRRINEQIKKINQRRNYIVGEMFIQIFPQCLSLNPGKKEENPIIFKPLKKFLLELSVDEKWSNRLKEIFSDIETKNNEL
ncbi:MAG: hypothetical protein NC452_11185 [Eubacterium sp.]|nr:hypothetical protein [Eubacterium sp.]